MAMVYIPTLLRPMTGGVATLELEGSTVSQLIAALDQRCPGIATHLLDGDALARGLAVSINGAVAPLGARAKVSGRSEVHFLPAIGGG